MTSAAERMWASLATSQPESVVRQYREKLAALNEHADTLHVRGSHNLQIEQLYDGQFRLRVNRGRRIIFARSEDTGKLVLTGFGYRGSRDCYVGPNGRNSGRGNRAG